jgi:hypothetical protein
VRRRLLGAALSLVGHAAVLIALFSATGIPPKVFEPPAVRVDLIDGRALAPAEAPTAATAPAATSPPALQTPTAPAPPTPPKPLPRHAVARPLSAMTPAQFKAAAQAAEDAPIPRASPELSGAQLAGAASADAGDVGGSCDMARGVQDALRRDPRVQSAVSVFAGKAVRVWDGDWVWFQGDVGQGLTAVRQAIEWQIAYAPESCRSRPMHGLVVFSLNPSGHPVRLAVGSTDWRWSDLVTTRSGR